MRKEIAMAKKTRKPRPWTKEDVRMLKTMLRQKTKTSVIARQLKRTVEEHGKRRARLV
jgi:hypothetical protein